jgi:hypothetical protein
MRTHRIVSTSLLLAILTALTACSSNGLAPLGSTAQSQRGAAAARAACQPDFTLSLNPSSATISSGQSVRVIIQLTSTCGLSGTIFVGITNISPPPTGNNGPTFTQSRYDVPLTSNGSASAYITFGATPQTLKTTYAFTIVGKAISGCCHGLTHQATFRLTVK